jgi:hypothetical protein
VNFAYTDRQVLVRLGEGFMADKADGSLVAFEVDRLDQPDSVAWSVLVRGLATILSDDERQRLEDVGPRPLIPAPGQIILAIRTDVVTGRRFPVGDAAPSPSSMGPVAGRAVSSPTPSGTATTPGV